MRAPRRASSSATTAPMRLAPVISATLSSRFIVRRILQRRYAVLGELRGITLEDLEQLLQRVQFLAGGVDDGPALLQRGLRPILLLEPDLSVRSHVDNRGVHRFHIELHGAAFL